MALSSAFASAAFAQTIGRPLNDGGLMAEPSGSPQYNSAGQVVPAPAGTESVNCAERFQSFDPTSGTYLGRDGRRHPCS
jgi:hypothetical protein